MSYFPEDIPFMSKEELRENGIRIPKDATDTNVGDTISRQAAIDALDCINGVEEVLRSLPPAQPEVKEGHWIKHIDPFDGEQYECSECGVLWEFNDGTPEDNEAYFCPKCGAKLKGETT